MPNITKKNLIHAVSDKTGLTQVDTGIVIESFLEAVSGALRQGKNIEIRGFGSFKLKKKLARKARNPRTGETVHVKAGVRPVFLTSRELARRVDAASEAAELAESVSHPQINNDPFSK